MRPKPLWRFKVLQCNWLGGTFKGIVVFSFTFDSVFKENQSFGIAQIVYGVFIEYLTDLIRGFVELKLGKSNYTTDLYRTFSLKSQFKS
jgi:hypothetical protein